MAAVLAHKDIRDTIGVKYEAEEILLATHSLPSSDEFIASKHPPVPQAYTSPRTFP